MSWSTVPLGKASSFLLPPPPFSPDLTWRDVQYLLVYTANRNRLVDGDWVTNGAGLNVSLQFGFGAIDAEALVSRGRHWMNVPPQRITTITPPDATL